MCPAKMVYDGSYAALFAMWNTRRPPAIDRERVENDWERAAKIAFAHNWEVIGFLLEAIKPYDVGHNVAHTHAEDAMRQMIQAAPSLEKFAEECDITGGSAALSDSTPTEPKE